MTSAPVNDKLSDQSTAGESDLRVLLTGFGPFAYYAANPSWLAVSKLHNKRVDLTTNQGNTINSEPTATSRKAHITTIKIPTRYTAILETMPLVHARPPVLPDAVPTTDNSTTDLPCQPLPHIPPPASGYDLVMHVGVWTRDLRVERKAHKTGYQEKDAYGEFAPEIKGKVYTKVGNLPGGKEDATPEVLRGFADRYEQFPEDLFSDVKTGRIFDYLIDKGYKEVTASTDPGHYGCDFLYYCSLAEAERTAASASKDPKDGSGSVKKSKVLFLHCPPVGEPYDSDEVANVVEQIISLVFSES